MIHFKHSGSFKNTETFFIKAKAFLGLKTINILDKYGQDGVNALRNSTPKDTGLTSMSWKYDIVPKKEKIELVWSNSNENKGVNIAIILQYGHGTATGTYVEGIDYINPAIRPIFEKIADNVWKEVTK